MEREANLPAQSLRSCSVFSHFRMNFPGSTSSVLHCVFITFLVEHRSPSDRGFMSPAVELLSSSSSLHTHPIFFLLCLNSVCLCANSRKSLCDFSPLGGRSGKIAALLGLQGGSLGQIWAFVHLLGKGASARSRKPTSHIIELKNHIDVKERDVVGRQSQIIIILLQSYFLNYSNL